MTDRQTDTSTDNKGRLDLSGDARTNRQCYCICNNRLHLASTAMPESYIDLQLATFKCTKVELDNEIVARGVAWTGVDMSTPLLPEVVPEIDANPVSFYSEGGGWGRSDPIMVTETEANLLLPLGTKS